MRSVWHVMFGCPEEKLIFMSNRIVCLGCKDCWYTDVHGKWINNSDTVEERLWEIRLSHGWF